MSMYKIMLIILFVTVSYYPFCGIVGLIRYIIRGEKYPREYIADKNKKQEPVLDKIRTEIKYKMKIQLKGEESEWNECISEVLEIIDKYRKESEE